MRLIISALALVVFSGAYCVGPFPPEPREDILERFGSAEEMLGYMNEQAARRVQPPPIMTADGDQSGSDADEFSSTNVQESGVDESDVVKNDGTYIYLLRNPSLQSAALRIVKAVPADALQEVASLDLFGARFLYLAGDKLVALASNSVSLIDITDRAHPVIQQTWEFNTNIRTSRLIGNKLHLVLTESLPLRFDQNGQLIPFESLDSLLPGVKISGPDGLISEGAIADWSAFYRPVVDSFITYYIGATLLATLNIDDLSAPLQTAGVLVNPGVVYASTSSVYLGEARTDVAPVGPFGWMGNPQPIYTTIHKFDITGDRPVYVGGGVVSGHLLNQYSLGEKDGYLRLGCTTGEVWNGSAVNAVYVLGESVTPGQLEIVGQVQNIAPGEKIYSARFIGDRGFLVTFKKVDPLFTLDLSDPADPQVIGQLKVPGYSDYIHLMDADHLLTIGKDAYDMGSFAWYQGVQLSIFDITNFAEPQLLAKEIIGVRGTESEANYNPRAFNYFAPKDALAIPISLAEGPTQQPSQSGQSTFAGLYVYRTTISDGFQLLGRIDTPEAAYRYYYSDRTYTRGIFIGDYVYSVSFNRVIAAPISDPSQVQSSLLFEPQIQVETGWMPD